MRYILSLIILVNVFLLSACDIDSVNSTNYIGYDFFTQDIGGNNKTTFTYGEDVRMVMLKQNLTDQTLYLTGQNPDVIYKVYRDSILVGSSTDNMTYQNIPINETIFPYTINQSSYNWSDNQGHAILERGNYTAEVSYRSWLQNYNINTAYLQRVQFVVQ